MLTIYSDWFFLYKIYNIVNENKIFLQKIENETAILINLINYNINN